MPAQNRRQFLGRASGAAATVLVPAALASEAHGNGSTRMFRGGRFPDGVVSGDPSAHGISLWTRFDPSSAVSRGYLELEVARDSGFRRVVARRLIVARASTGYTVRARVTGLPAHEQYYYRFASATESSSVGRFRTMPPADSRETIRFAFWSCQDYTNGYYNAHELMARQDYDFMVCLGDYIYAETYHSTARGDAVRNDTIGRRNPTNDSIIREALTLSDYRRKYRLYRSDPALREVHRRFPMVMVWDDHEIQDNYAGGAAGGGLPAGKRFSAARTRAARRAFYENMPAFAGADGRRLYRSVRCGKNLELLMTDQRSYRDNQPCGDAIVAPCADYDKPRDFLGRRQMGWLKDRLSRSDATWKVLGSEVTVMPTRVLGGANYTYDNWIGYPRERAELLSHIKDRKIKDVVFVTGDIHIFIAGDVRTGDGAGGETVATEFVGGSITSNSLGEVDLPIGNGQVIRGNNRNPQTPQTLIDALRGINPQVDNADLDHHGYGEVVVGRSELRCRLVRMKTIKRRTRATLPDADWTYVVRSGRPSIKGQHGPAAT